MIPGAFTLVCKLLFNVFPITNYSSGKAGDTAQSISKDSLFRFANAKALFHTRFSKLLPVYGNQSFLVPKLLPLSHNFRSHKGILALASLVMELLYTGMLLPTLMIGWTMGSYYIRIPGLGRRAASRDWGEHRPQASSLQ